MGQRIVHKRSKKAPLPVRDGLNPSRARLPLDAPPTPARDFIAFLVQTQTHRHGDDNDAAIDARFAAREVVDLQGRPFSPEQLVTPGADVWFYRIPAPEPMVPYDCPTLYEDERLLVVDKPPFLSTLPRGRHITETALVRLRRQTGNHELSPAHRLDRLTSGVLIFTKTPGVRRAYQELFATRQTQKVYEAIAPLKRWDTPVVWEHRMEHTRGSLQTFITDGEPNARTELVSVSPLTQAEQAQCEKIYGPTEGELPPLGRYTLRPTTGRTHQLRVHMWLAGAPILGDPIYPVVLPENVEDYGRPLQLLARSLSFVDPFTESFHCFQSQRTQPISAIIEVTSCQSAS